MNATIEGLTEFRLAISANPDDNAPRLIFADWLEEQQTEWAGRRAKLIRLGMELESIKNKAAMRHIAASLRKEIRLLACADASTNPSGDTGLIYDELREVVGYSQLIYWLHLFNNGEPRWGQIIGPNERGSAPIHFCVNRGFLSHLAMSKPDWDKHGLELVRWFPVERLWLLPPYYAEPVTSFEESQRILQETKTTTPEPTP